MQENQSNKQRLERISEILQMMRDKLVEELNRRMFSEHSKITIKILVLREVLAKRIYELAQAAFNLFAENKIIPAIILTRSVVETSACLEYLYEGINSSLSDKSTEKLEKILMKMFIGTKNDPEVVDPIHLMDIIRKVDKKYDGFLFSYEELSEFCHPNWAGCIGSYSEIMSDSPIVKVGMSDAVMEYPKDLGIVSLLGAMELFLSAYINLRKIIGKFILHSEKY